MKMFYPAEWETQKSIWLAFPHSKNWRGKFRDRIREFYFELIHICARFQPVNVLVPFDFRLPDSEQKKFFKAKFKPKFIPLETDDIWIRDYGPFFVYDESGNEIAVKFEFNAWGRKFPPWSKDNAVPSAIATFQKIPILKNAFLFEGGAIEVNGDGLGMTTLPCLVGKNRNDIRAQKEFEKSLKESLGLRDLLILPHGLYGDHTDGHIDNVARFVSNSHVIIAKEDSPKGKNHRSLLQAKLAIEKWLTSHYGKSARVDALQLPTQKPFYGGVLPASYMNFIFLNGALVYPKYEKGCDLEAESFFKELFPDREIIGIDATTVIRQGGSLHCISKQESAFPSR